MAYSITGTYKMQLEIANFSPSLTHDPKSSRQRTVEIRPGCRQANQAQGAVLLLSHKASRNIFKTRHTLIRGVCLVVMLFGWKLLSEPL